MSLPRVPRIALAVPLVLLVACSDDDGGGVGIVDPPIDPPETGWTAIAAGATHACGLWGPGVAYCWGGNDRGQLGVGTLDLASSSRPTRVETELRFKALALGQFHSCGVTVGGDVHCWGENALGQLGDGTDTDAAAPVPVDSNEEFDLLSAGAYHTCGLTGDGRAFCWGGGGGFEDGRDLALGFVPPDSCAFGSYFSTRCSQMPRPVGGGFTFTEVSAGLFHTCAVTTEGRPYCWGWNQGQLGNGEDHSNDPDNTAPGYVEPQPLSGQFSFASISAGGLHSCGVTSEGVAYCWGAAPFERGELGTGDLLPHLVPEFVDGDVAFQTVHAAAMNSIYNAYSCGLDADGAAWCWGANRHGQLGAAAPEICGTDIPCALSPQRVSGDRSFDGLALGLEFTCGVTGEGTAWCWGLNEVGQLGDGGTGSTTTPVQVLDPPEAQS